MTIVSVADKQLIGNDALQVLCGGVKYMDVDNVNYTIGVVERSEIFNK